MGRFARWIVVSALAAAAWLLGTPALAGAAPALGEEPTSAQPPHCTVRSPPGAHAQPGAPQAALFEDDDDDDDDADDDAAVHMTPARLVQPRVLEVFSGAPPRVGERAVETREHRRLVERPPNA